MKSSNPRSSVLLAATVGAALLFAGCVGTTTDNKTTDSSTSSTSSAPVAATAGGTYTEYNEALLAKAEEGKVVLFFKASWCSTCRALDKNINANLDNLPEDVTILEVDYDSETELRRKYGVTLQHTLVQVDANGEMIKKWTGGNTLDTTLGQIE